MRTSVASRQLRQEVEAVKKKNIDYFINTYHIIYITNIYTVYIKSIYIKYIYRYMCVYICAYIYM